MNGKDPGPATPATTTETTPAATTTPPATTEPPAAGTPPVTTTTPAAPATTTPAASAAPAPAVPPTTPAPAAANSNTTPPAATTQPAATPPPATETPLAIDYTKIAGGRFKSEEELLAHITSHNNLQQQVTTLQSQVSFRSDSAQKLYDLVNKIDGQPVDAVQRYLHVHNLPIDKLSDQQLRLEAFLLDPKVQASGMSQDDLRAAFQEREVRLYGDPENTVTPRTPGQLFDEKMATQEAKATLLRAKEELKSFGSNGQEVRQPSEAELAAEREAYRNLVKPQLLPINKMSLSIKSKDADGEEVTGNVNIDLDSVQHERMVNMVVDPVEWWDRKMIESGAMFKNDKGEYVYNPQKFADLAMRYELQAEREAAIYKQGREDMMAKIVRANANPISVNNHGAAPPATPEVKKDVKETLAEGVFSQLGMR